GGKSLVVALAGTIAAEPDAGNASRQVQAAVDLPELGIVSLQRCPVVARLVVKSAPCKYVSRSELTARCELAGPMISIGCCIHGSALVRRNQNVAASAKGLTRGFQRP